ncbi:unnamed protein product [Nippostrongylus brasiliensis]|uniref:SCP domain-containing protein n=1 Tax=Nippostrongylus brasiliensis TaxID=27835 RepID=A0A158QZT0_NIPBR|nr:unnamed protein product [Nippostrongylus brasiliensis]
MACSVGPYNDGESILLICAYNVRGAVVGETIYEIAKAGEYPCKDGTKCGTDGTCVSSLCNVPIRIHDTLLPIFKPTLSCTDLPFMSQFSRYYALNLHNYYSGTNVEVIDDVNITREAALERAVTGWFNLLRRIDMDPNTPWEDVQGVRSSANMLHDNYNVVGCAVNICSAKGFTIVDCRYGQKRPQDGDKIYEYPPMVALQLGGSLLLQEIKERRHVALILPESCSPAQIDFTSHHQFDGINGDFTASCSCRNPFLKRRSSSTSPTTADVGHSLTTGTQEPFSTLRATSTTERGTTPATSSATLAPPEVSVAPASGSPFPTHEPIITATPTMGGKTTPATKSVTSYELLSKTYASSTVSLPIEPLGSFSTSYATPTMKTKTTRFATKPTTLYEILSKTPAGSTTSLRFKTKQSLTTPFAIHSSATMEQKTTSATASTTTLFEILSTSTVSSTSSLSFETRSSFSTSSGTPTTERKTSSATSSPTLYEILSKSSAGSTTAVPFQEQQYSSSAAVTIESETTPSTRSATLYEILSKSAASSMDWSTRSKTSSVEPLMSGSSLSYSATQQPIFTTRSGKGAGSTSPFESGTISSIASTTLEPGMETQETSSGNTLSFETTVDREMASSQVVELEETSYGAAEDMTVGTTQEGLEQSSDQAEATGTVKTTDTTVNQLEDHIFTGKDSAESTHGNTTVYGSNKASTVTSTSYAEIYASTGILSTLLNRGKASTTSGQWESGDDQSTEPSGEPSDSTLRQTVSPPEPIAVPSSTSTFVPPSFDTPTSMFVLGGMDKSTRAPLTSKLFSTLRGFGNVSPLSTPTHDSAVERYPATKPTAPNQDHSTPESMETQSEARTTSDSSLQSTTRDFQCAYPCPIGLLEGPDYCYQLLKAQPLLNYRKAFHLCAVEGDSDMADEVDLRNPQVLQLLRNVSETDGAERHFFVNERDSKLYMEEKKVRVVSLKWSTRFFLYVNETVAPRQYVENVTAACKRPKFCGEYYCNLNDYEFLVPDSVLVIPETQNRTLAVGESVTIRCNNSETEVVKVQCRQKGYLNPHPTRVACQGASIIAMTGSLVLLIRGLIALFYEQHGNDPQTFYQNCRCFFVALAGLFAFLFRHPALLQITQIQCMFSSFVMTCSFLFAVSSSSLFSEYLGLELYIYLQFRTLTPLIVLTAVVAGTFKGKPADATISSKMGRRLKRRWTAKYKKLREENNNKTKAQIVTMVFRKRVRHDLYHAKNEACRRKIRRLFDEWWRETYTVDRQPDPVLKLKTRQPEEDRAIQLCYVSIVDDYGNTQIEEVMKTPTELADLPSTSRPRDEAADGGEGGNIPDHEDPLAWIQELTDSTFKMAVQNYDYLERPIVIDIAQFQAIYEQQSPIAIMLLLKIGVSYDRSLEEVANENVKKCERQTTTFGKVSAASGRNVYIIEDINITKEVALERAVVEWFSELSTYGVDPISAWTGDPTVKNCANVMHDQYKTVGCAVNSCSSQGFTIVECRYGPKSLQQGGPIYDVGDPCTKCTGARKCVFGQLCQ